ncbi:MAG: uracil-DNA glycosylase family protein [Pseudomonadota bacterium]
MGPEPTDAALLAALAWQVELGADEAISDTPVDRFAASAPTPSTPATSATPAQPRAPDGAAQARADARHGSGVPTPESPPDTHTLAESANSLAELAEAMKSWDGTPLKATAKNFVFSDGHTGSRLMVVGEAPGADEDRIGRPFVGRAGQLLDKMLAAIGQSRTDEDPAKSVYIANILPWRPPGNRTPSEQEVQSYLPFMERHIQLAKPEVIFAVGNTSVKALLNTQTGIKRLRGNWHRHPRLDLPVMPSFHPAYLLRQAQDKRLAWRDLLALRAVLDGENT